MSPNEIFSEHAYFSSYSDSWLRHAQSYVEAVVEHLDLHADSLVVELGSNDGYLLQYFRPGHSRARSGAGSECGSSRLWQGHSDPCGVLRRGHSATMVAEGLRPQLIVGNNVLAQVPDLNGFVAGIEDCWHQRERRRSSFRTWSG